MPPYFLDFTPSTLTVTSNNGGRDSSKDSNMGMDIGNNMGSMGFGNKNMVQDEVADGIL